jgi:hypothetical protein
MPRPLVLVAGIALLVAIGSAFVLLDRPGESAPATPAPIVTAAMPAPEPMPPPVAREPTVEEIAAHTASDAAEAVHHAGEIADDDERAAALHECLPQWLRADPAAARAWLLETGRTFSPEVILSLVRDTAPLAPELALALAESLPAGQRSAATAEIFEAWSTLDPAQAAARARFLAGSRRDPREVAGAETTDRETAAAHLARQWADRAPQAAQAWALTLPDPAQRRAALDALFTTWAEAEPATAAEAARTLPEREPGRIRLIDRVLTHWAASDPAAALDWLQTLPAPAEREAAAATLLTGVVQSQPAEAAAWALQLGAGSDGSLLAKVLAAWAAADKPAALAWAAALPPGDTRDISLRELNP